MKSCILTVIKNEHEYLDEWIKYHLDLGIDHIFILEDTDSDTHKFICDKYGDKVSLESVLIVLSEKDIIEAKEVKELKKYSVQHMYFRNGLNYIKRLYFNEYDWCFLIDNDEFITLENDNDKLEDVLSLFEEYNAFVMSWKRMGANGYINKPDYSNKGVIEIFTEEAKGQIPNQVKSCYKLKTFKNEFLYTHHHPTDLCKWCNTDDVYFNYFKHEEPEQVDKIRLGIWNNDIYKNKLIKQVKNDILVVLPYKQNGAQGNEIRFALNGWRKNCQFKYYFVVIGEFDEHLKNEFTWVKFINCPTKDKKEKQYNPHLDIQNKFNVIYRLYAQEYDGFIYMTDDEYAIKPFDLKDIMKTYYLSTNFIGNEKQPTSYWNYDKWKTRQLLDRENLPHINYTTHYPCYFEFKKLKEIWLMMSTLIILNTKNQNKLIK